MHPFAWIEQEAAIAALVFDTTRQSREFRTPRVGEIVTVAGRYGLLYQRTEGKPLTHVLNRSSLTSINAVGARLAELHFAIHRIRFAAGTAGRGMPSQRAVLNACIAKASNLPISLRDAARRSLTLIDSELRDDCLCHGDFHPLNVLVTGDGQFAVIDWWSAARGSAIADLARTLILLEFGRMGDAQVFAPAQQALRMKLRDAYLKRYFELAAWSEADVQLKQWILLAAVARLNSGIGNAERSSLLAFVQQLLQEEMLYDQLHDPRTRNG